MDTAAIFRELQIIHVRMNFRGITVRHANIRSVRLISLLWLCIVAGAGQAAAQAAPQATPQKKTEKASIAVFDLRGIRTEETTSAAASDRLREELLKTGHFKLLNRNTLDRKLAEQGLNQATCMEADCALKVGKVLGARLVLTGRIIIIDSGAWQISAEITEVSTGETVVAGSTIYQGNLVGLISKGIPQVVDKLIPAGDSGSYGDIVDFLQQRSSTLSIAARSGARRGEDKRAGQELPSDDTPIERKYRIWGSPFSVFSMKFTDNDFNKQETFLGTGISVGFEAQFHKIWSAGAAFHAGSLDHRKSPIDGSNAEVPISGDYQTINLLILGAVPQARPWFYFGTGLGHATMDWNDAGVTGSDSVTSILLMLRLAYTFDSGFMLGYDFQGSFIGSSSGDRHDALRDRGVTDPEADSYVGFLFLGYQF